MAAQQDALKNRARGFGYKASLLGNAQTSNTATGQGSLLGN